MKILHIADSIKGGIATQLNSLWPNQAERFGTNAVRMAIPAAHRPDLPDVPDKAVHLLPDTSRRPQGLAQHTKAVAQAIVAENPDVVHAHSAIAGAAVRFLKTFGQCGAPIVYCPHGWAFDRADGTLAKPFYAAAERFLAPKAAAILCISKHEYWRARQLGIARHRLYLVYNGLPGGGTAPPRSRPKKKPPAERQVLHLAFVGRLDRQKGFDVLLSALGKVQREVRLTCIGAPVLNDSRITADIGALRHQVDFLGWQPPNRVHQHIADSDLVVVPSRWEGFGLVAAEALQSGTPVIASRCGGLTEVIADGVTGRLVPPDDPQALAEAIEQLDDKDLQTWTQQAPARFQAYFNAERMARRVDSIYALLGVSACNESQLS